MITAVEPLLITAMVVAVVVLTAVKISSRRALRDMARRRNGGRIYAPGAYVMAAVFAGLGLYILVTDLTGETRRGLPNWLAGGLLVICGVSIVVVTVRRTRGR